MTYELPNWGRMGRALCSEIDPELFFPKKGADPYTIKSVKAICNKCELVEPCFTYALKDEEIKGIWGATTTEDRKMMRRNKRARSNLEAHKRAS